MSLGKNTHFPIKQSWAIVLVAQVLILVGVSCNAQPEMVTQPDTEQSTLAFNSTPTPTSTTSPTPSLEPSPTPEIPQNTQIPTVNILPTQTEENSSSPFVPIIGTADKIAFVNQNEIWIANLDGQALTQLTDDEQPKSSLQWAPDRKGVIYLSGLCINIVDIESNLIAHLACFDQAGRLESFNLSPDGKHAAISLDGQLFVIPFDEDMLSQARSGEDLITMADCETLAPYKHRISMVTVSKARWSTDGNRLAILRQAYDADRHVELIHLIDITRCSDPPPRLDEFPATRFEMDDYDRNPIIQDFAWNGADLFALSSYKRNDGFGDLWIYSTDLHRGFKANPIEGKCCYRDPVFSPDGKYLAFVFQDASLVANGPAVLYYLPYAALESGLAYPPINLPADFFMEPRTKPQPILRSAR
jgi:dipeptidyl aminopeptidase/acylaminoacyl peptidase